MKAVCMASFRWFFVLTASSPQTGRYARGLRMLNAGDVLPAAGVHADSRAVIHEQRHLNHEASLRGRGLGGALRRVARKAGLGVGDLQVHVRRKLDLDWLV